MSKAYPVGDRPPVVDDLASRGAEVAASSLRPEVALLERYLG